MATRLLVSMSGISAESLDRGAAFAAELDARGVNLSQLFRPAPADAALVRWMHERGAAGDAIVLHGFDHTADPIGNGHSAAPARIGRRAEFAALPRHEAGLRLTAARRALAAAELWTDAFVPPRWLASPGTVEALREQGFAVLADELGIRALQAGWSVDARILGFQRTIADDRKAAEAWRCRVLLAETTRAARRGGLVRINVRAKDLRRPARREAALAAIDAALALGATPTTYRLAPATTHAA
jgi:uncharacterized protein